MTFTLFDPADQCFRVVRDDWIDRLLAGDQVGLKPMPDPLKSRSRRRLDRVLSALKLRRQAVFWLDRLRRGGHAGVAPAATALQLRLAMPHERARMFNRDGSERVVTGYGSVVGEKATLAPDSVLVSAGYGWLHHNIGALARDRQERGFRHVLLCYDLIPDLFPAFYKARDVERFRSYMAAAFGAADRIIFNSEAVRVDAARFCREHGLALPGSAIVPLGADFAAPRQSRAPLPDGLAPGRFALFVSTLEPRKGHAFLLELWQRLAAEGVPAKANFKLVFVGRPGWMVEALTARLKDPAIQARGVIWLESVDDALLDTLYRNAAFCLFPSQSEGYGLPVVEAFHHGKPVMASTGGALPEVVGRFSPCLDLSDGQAWLDMLRSWIMEPSAYAHYAAMLRDEFRHPSWPDFCQRFFAEAAIPAQPPARPGECL